MAKRAQPGELNDRQKRFVAEYLVDLNATQAAIRAGYSVLAAQPVSSRLLSNAMIQAAIAKGQQAAIERIEITQDYVRKRMKKEAEFEGEGSSHSARVTAAKLLGQLVGLWSDKLELTGKGGNPLFTFAQIVESKRPASHDDSLHGPAPGATDPA